MTKSKKTKESQRKQTDLKEGWNISNYGSREESEKVLSKAKNKPKK